MPYSDLWSTDVQPNNFFTLIFPFMLKKDERYLDLLFNSHFKEQVNKNKLTKNLQGSS